MTTNSKFSIGAFGRTRRGPTTAVKLPKQEWNGLIDIDTDRSREVFITTW